MILVVEDHADTRSALMYLLGSEGYQSTGVGTGEDALAFLATHVPACILLDYNLPGMNGLDILQQMRADPRLAKVPVILFSANLEGIRNDPRAATVSEFVTKGTLDWLSIHKEILHLAGPATGTPQMPRPLDSAAEDVC